MKKITFLALFSFCAIGLSQAQNVELPAAYYNNSATTVGENAGIVNNGPRNTNVSIPFTGTYYNNMAPNGLLYDNGPYWNTAGSPNVSLLESVTLGMNTLGSGAQFGSGNSVADDVIFPEPVEITSIEVFAYQTGSSAPSITAVYLQVYDGDPSAGGSVIWGDLTTNIIDEAIYAEANRYSETNIGDTSRQIQTVIALTPGLSLAAGTYWIEYTFEGTGSSGPWAPPIAILGETTTGNALQYQTSISSWVALEDSGTFTPQGLPFLIYGDVVAGVNDNKLAGFNFSPNPTSGSLSLKSLNNIESVSIFNLLGQKVKDVKIGATTSDINISDLNSGTYIMQVTVAGQIGTYKVIKN